MEHSVAAVIRPSVLNALIVFAMVIVVGFCWRMGSAYFSDSSVGEAGAVIY